MAVSDWSVTAGSNTSVGAVSIAENCPPANLNNAQREVMAQLRAVLTDAAIEVIAKASVAEIRTALGVQAVDATLTALAGVTSAADKLPFFTGADAASVTGLSAFMRTVLDDASATDACTTLGAVRLISGSFANPGHIKLAIGAGTFVIAWGSATAAANTSTPVSYGVTCSTASFAVCSGGVADPDAQDNPPDVISCSPTGFTVASARDASTTIFYLAVGY